MMAHPKITIGIPCYNAENTIQRAIESALTQDWENCEILVVDDASSDRSTEIVQAICKKEERVRLIVQEQNLGPGGIREKIVKNATGEYIAFFDDDDQSFPSRVRIQLRRLNEYELESDQKLIACYASGERKYPNDYVLNLPAIASSGEAIIGNEIADYLLLSNRNPNKFYGAGTPTSALMARKSTIESIGNFDRTFRRVEDLDFAIRLGRRGGHFIGCPEKLYRQYATIGTDKTALANFQAELQLIDKHKQYLVSKKRYTYVKCWFKFRYYHFSKQNLRAIWTLIQCWLRNPVIVTKHFLRSAPKRFVHEIKMGKQNKST